MTKLSTKRIAQLRTFCDHARVTYPKQIAAIEKLLDRKASAEVVLLALMAVMP